MKLNKLDKAMVYWLVAQLCSLMVENEDEWYLYDCIKESNSKVWDEIINGRPMWFNTYGKLDSWGKGILSIQRDVDRMVNAVFAEVCSAKK